MEKEENKADIPSPFERLPPSVKHDIAQRKLEQENTFREIRRRRMLRIAKATIAGAVIATLLNWWMTEGFPPILLLTTFTGAITALLVVKYNLNHLLSMILFGCSGVALSQILFWFDLISLKIPIFFSAWLFYLIAGAVIGIWAELQQPRL